MAHVQVKHGGCLFQRKACALNEQPVDFVQGACALDELPLALASWHSRQQRVPDCREIRPPSNDDHDWSSQRRGQRLDVHDVEACECDSLQQHRMQLGVEARLLDAGRQRRGCVRSVAADETREHAVESFARKDGADNQNVAAMIGRKRRVIESNNVRPALAFAPHWPPYIRDDHRTASAA